MTDLCFIKSFILFLFFFIFFSVFYLFYIIGQGGPFLFIHRSTPYASASLNHFTQGATSYLRFTVYVLLHI